MHTNPESTYIAWIDGDCRADKDRLMSLWKILKDNNNPKVA